MKKQQNTINMLLNFIGRSNRIDEKEKIVILINAFFSKGDNKDIPSFESLKVTKIDVIDSDNEKVSVVFELMEAGLLVGKDGTTIKQLGGFLSKKIDKKVKIIVENNKTNSFKEVSDEWNINSL